MSLLLRAARPTDAGTAGEILHGFAEETAWMPRLHSQVEAIAFCGTMIDRGWVTVAELEGRVAGFLARDGEEICGLYLARAARRRGIGARLLARAKAECPRLVLRSFEANASARRFYRREGFVEAGRRAGAENDENLPDIAYVWYKEAPSHDQRPGSV
ncbi:L-amino acid N-acyltransferase YncA [Cribrihabitans marinus]|uniref:L-amino acid N-acyltransferase YncA n=1 Tax=Cribrihabitans marinus TaxID=1227549 RepID=A0A1H7BH39_9RHOB|nr:GNAT family N-acetyltransferase [Cribrihabitans marinus]GGH34493.1 N-acetyltransferase GCN5 [Cribrihabitans marinus]SEJ76939.1 L-amino acid N-acyltransferase YncA [Cribrihabitans marinus]